MYTDCHIHIVPIGVVNRLKEEFIGAIKNLDVVAKFGESSDYLVEYLDKNEIEAVAIMSYPSPETHGGGIEVVEALIDYCKPYRDRLYPFGSVHPRLMDANEIEESLEKQYSEGIAGIKLHPVHQHFKPNDYREEERGLKTLESVYEFASDHSVPLLFHTGTSILPGARSKFGNPLFLEDVAIDFPELRIIMSHGGRPFWMKEAFYVLRRFSNVWLDISGIPPQKLLTEYFPRFEDIAKNSLYGSDFPSPGVRGIRENLELFLNLPLDKRLKEKITYGNFKKLLR
jgi:hypothetical protein